MNELTSFMKTILNPFEINLKLKYEQLCNNEIKRNLKNLIYILNKTYRNGSNMIWSIDINGLKMNSKLIKCTLPFPRVNASLASNHGRNTAQWTISNTNMIFWIWEKKLNLEKICFLLKKKNSWHSKDFEKIGIKQNLKLKKLGN